MEERLQKFLARSGVASRRKAEELIAGGRVKVNAQKVTELGTKVDPARDLVTVDGKLISAREAEHYYLLYKPSGCVTTLSDPEGRPTAGEYLRDTGERVFPVGRLDYDAEGALLFTTDGDLAHKLAHPRYGHARVYLVKVKGEPSQGQLDRMRSGVRLEDGPGHALEAVFHEKAEKNTWIKIRVGEGRYHLVKRLCESVGLHVQRLFRPEFGGVSVEGLQPGQYRELTPVEVEVLRRAVGQGGPSRDTAAGRGTSAPPPRSLPKAARRHGHGPPPPPGGRPDAEARPRGERGEEAERGDRREHGERQERGERREHDQRHRGGQERGERGGRSARGGSQGQKSSGARRAGARPPPRGKPARTRRDR